MDSINERLLIVFFDWMNDSNRLGLLYDAIFDDCSKVTRIFSPSIV
jgi:hypothetical protein